MEVPLWLQRDSFQSQVISPKNVYYKHKFLDKTLNNTAKLLESTFFSDKYASQNGLLQKINPPIKVISIVSVVIFVNVMNDLPSILLIHLLTLILTILSKINLGFFFKRVWLVIPFFAGVIALPAMLNIFTPGDALITFVEFNQVQNIWFFQFTEISITQQGLNQAIFFVFRVATSISLVILLSLSTHWPDLLKSLRKFGIPQIFVLILSITYQYILLLARIVEDMYLAKKSRTIPHIKRKREYKGEQQWVASRIGTIFKKSYLMIDNIQLAMIARGFRGEVKILYPFQIKRRDYMWVLFIIITILGLSWLSI